MSMLKPITAAKVDKFLSSTRANVRKLYEVIPLVEAWTPAQIMGEMKRQGLSLFTMGQIVGTCSLLCRAGLIKELPGQKFKKHPTRDQARAAEARDQEAKQQHEEEQDMIKQVHEVDGQAVQGAVSLDMTQPGAGAQVVAEMFRGMPIADLPGALLEMADKLGERIATMNEPQPFTAEMVELEAENAALRAQLQETRERNVELVAIGNNIAAEKLEAKRIGIKWSAALTAEKELHDKTRDELHRAQGEIERLSAEVAKFAQLKLLLNGGL